MHTIMDEIAKTTHSDFSELEVDIASQTTEISWAPPADMTYDQWECIGATLQQVDRSMRWWIGDWLNVGERNWGETYAQAIQATDASVETLKKYKSVADRIGAQDRHANLSWTHHFYVAYVKQELRSPLLCIAEDHSVSSRMLKQIAQLPNSDIELIILASMKTDMDDLTNLLSIVENYGTLVPPVLEIHSEDDDSQDDVEVVIDGNIKKYNTDQADAVEDFWDETDVPLQAVSLAYAEWEGISVMAIEGEDGSPMLLWEIDKHV